MTSLKITPLVSVIIAFLNEKQFLREAIESVIQQDYNNWELILVDDGSSDESTHIALEYTEKFPEKIRYCEHEGHTNKGLSASRNLGVKHAKGELVAFLDADDIWLSHKLSNQVSIFSLDSSVSMVVESSLYWYSWNDLKSEDVIIYVGADANRVYNPPELMYQLYPLGYGNAPCPSGLMLKHSLFTKVGGFEESFDKQYQLYEDQAFLCKIYLHEKVYISSACHNWYRQRPNSIVKWVKQKGHYHTVRQYFLEYLQNYINQQNISNKYLKQLLRKALLPYHHPIIYFITGTVPHMVWRVSKKAIPANIKRFIKSQLANYNSSLKMM